jgi:hypothetical protein
MTREEALAGFGEGERQRLFDSLIKVLGNLSERGAEAQARAAEAAAFEPRRGLRHG